jgi:hypothetical protein
VTAALAACTDRFERRLVETSAALRLEMHDGFATLRQEMDSGLAALRQEMRDGDAALRQEMTGGFAALRQEMALRHTDLLKWCFLFWLGQVAVIAGILLRATN